MTDKPFDPTKPVRTRDGTPARIICTDRSGDGGIVALLTVSEDGSELPEIFSDSGRFLRNGEESGYDLVNVPEKHVRWVNFYPGKAALACRSRETADTCAVSGRIACKRIEYEEGEGL